MTRNQSDSGSFFMAEKEGFEPSIPLWGIHDFQSCALGQLRDFSIAPGMPSPDIIAHSHGFVKKFFAVFRIFPETGSFKNFLILRLGAFPYFHFSMACDKMMLDEDPTKTIFS